MSGINPTVNTQLASSLTQNPLSSAAPTPIEGPQTVKQNLNNAANNGQRSYVQDGFWLRPDTDITKWNTSCPYQLLVVQVQKNNNTLSYTPYLDWQYTLPLPPESFSISTPFAIQTTVTLGGIVEEHNAAPIRQISFRGTTGFLPLRQSGADKSGTGPQAYKSGTGPQAYNVYQQADFNINGPNANLIKTSGFNQIVLLRDFLESYVAKKKINDDEAKSLRLAVAIWKEDQIFLVTPIGFNVVKDSSSPFEYKYSLDFKAWKRVKLNAVDNTPVSPTPIRNSPNLLARAINTVTAARQAVEQIGALKQAVLGDIDYVLTPFHDTVLLCKDTVGATLSLSDVPLSIKQQLSVDVSNIKYSSPQLWNTLSSGQTSDPSSIAFRFALQDTTSIQDTPTSNSRYVTNTGLNSTRATATTAAGIKPKKVALKDIPFELATQIPLSALNLSQDVKKDVQSDLTRVRNLRRIDFENYANTTRSTADKIAFLVGAGDPTYADVYGINVTPIKTTSTQSDWDTLNALENTITILQQFAATADGEPAQPPTTLEMFGGLAVASGIAWQQPVSKFAIPFPYSATLENLASRYLGDPNRYMEIVALNGLRAPYIDETGYQIPLLVNGKGQTVVINYNSDLFVGKAVWLSSNTANRVQYSIESIVTQNNISTIKMNADVTPYMVNDGAVLESFLTGTICSRNLIWIPSDVEPLDPDSVVTKDIPGVNVTDPMVSIGGVDLLLGADNDLALVDAEIRYAIGLANIVQWVKIVLAIQQGELVQHKSIGLPLSIGLSLADFSAQDVLNAIRKQLTQDSMFSSIDKISVVQNGPGVNISINAVVAGTSQPLPLNYAMALSQPSS